MTYPMGPSLTAELEYRRDTLLRIGRSTARGASRGTRRAERNERAARVATAERASAGAPCTPCTPGPARTRAA
jgi:hypothetical protein